MIRVAISGAGGKLATPIADAIAASDDLEVTALYNPNRAGAEMHGVTVTGAPSEVDADVVVETAHPDVVLDNLTAWRDKGLAAVVGTSGFTPSDWNSCGRSGGRMARPRWWSQTSRLARCS